MDMKFNVIHVSSYSGKETIVKKNVSLYEANEYFYSVDNTYIVEADETKESETIGG
jgi:hypothetical protein